MPVLSKRFLSRCAYTGTMKSRTQAQDPALLVATQTDSRQSSPFLLLSAACYLILANMYYAQPILADMTADVGLTTGASGLVITMLQVGYMLGILFLGPLGDVWENRRLIVGMTLGAGCFLALAAVCHSVSPFLAAHLGIGIFSAATQVVIVFAVSLASDAMRGRVLGIVTAGLFGGIVLARPTSSLLSEFVGWRGMYGLAAAAMLLLAWMLWRQLPRTRPSVHDMGYMAMLRSLCEVPRLVPHLSLWLLVSSLSFAALTMFWTAAPLRLLQDMHYSHAAVAVFALAGLTSPPCVILAGRLLDKGYGHPLRFLGTGLATGAWLLSLSADSGWILALAAVLLDPGVNVTTVSVQQAILATRPETRARCNSISVASNFCGGALGASLGPWLLAHHGWQTVAVTGIIVLGIAFLINLQLHKKERSCSVS